MAEIPTVERLVKCEVLLRYTIQKSNRQGGRCQFAASCLLSSHYDCLEGTALGRGRHRLPQLTEPLRLLSTYKPQTNSAHDVLSQREVDKHPECLPPVSHSSQITKRQLLPRYSLHSLEAQLSIQLLLSKPSHSNDDGVSNEHGISNEYRISSDDGISNDDRISNDNGTAKKDGNSNLHYGTFCAPGRIPDTMSIFRLLQRRLIPVSRLSCLPRHRGLPLQTCQATCQAARQLSRGSPRSQVSSPHTASYSPQFSCQRKVMP